MTTQIAPYWKAAKTHLRCVDPMMSRLIDLYEDPPLRTLGRPFETLVHAIVGQQISAKAADAIWRRFLDLVGEVSPAQVARHSREAYREVGLSHRKAEYILGLADSGSWIETHSWSEMCDDDIKSTLCGLRGVGPWTAEMVLIFSFMRPDIFPLGDIGIVRAIEALYHDKSRLTPEQLLKIAEPWRPFRTVGTWYIWRHLDDEPVQY